MTHVAEQVDAVLAELVEEHWTARRLAMPGDGGPALRVAVCPEAHAVFVLAVADVVTSDVLARTSSVSEAVTRKRRRTAGALPVVVTTEGPTDTPIDVQDGVLLTSGRGLADALRFEAERLGCHPHS